MRVEELHRRVAGFRRNVFGWRGPSALLDQKEESQITHGMGCTCFGRTCFYHRLALSPRMRLPVSVTFLHGYVYICFRNTVLCS